MKLSDDQIEALHYANWEALKLDMSLQKSRSGIILWLSQHPAWEVSTRRGIKHCYDEMVDLKDGTGEQMEKIQATINSIKNTLNGH